MPMERKTDLRVQKTRAAIKDAFKKMVMEMDASDITVKELTDRAMIFKSGKHVERLHSCRPIKQSQ